MKMKAVRLRSQRKSLYLIIYREQEAPTIVNDIIKYEAREPTKEERYRDSRKQSLLDNPRMLYFYESSGKYYHDRDCLEVKQIASERFAASEDE